MWKLLCVEGHSIRLFGSLRERNGFAIIGLVKREIGPSVAAPDPWLAVLGTGFILPVKDRRVGPVWNTHVDNIAHGVNGGYRVGPEGAMVRGGYDAALGRPLGSLAGGRILETMSVRGGEYSHFHRLLLRGVNQGDKIYRLDEFE